MDVNYLKKINVNLLLFPCNTAHYWYDDLQKKINIPIINMPKKFLNLQKKIVKKIQKLAYCY